MSLADRMAGALSANKPIDAEFCEMVGMVESDDVWQVCRPGLVVDVIGESEVYITDCTGDCVWLEPVNTQGRFLHLLAALGIEVPE